MQPDYKTLTDEDLMDAIIANRNEHAFGELVNRHSSRYYRMCYRMVNDRGNAEDLVQDAFVKLWHKPQQWQKSKNTQFTTWFYRVITNLCIDYNRKKKPFAMFENVAENITDVQDSPEKSTSKNQQKLRIKTAIGQLSSKQQIALNLCFYEELSNQEAADIMNLKLKTLQSLILRARTKLKRLLEEGNG